MVRHQNDLVAVWKSVMFWVKMRLSVKVSSILEWFVNLKQLNSEVNLEDVLIKNVCNKSENNWNCWLVVQKCNLVETGIHFWGMLCLFTRVTSVGQLRAGFFHIKKTTHFWQLLSFLTIQRKHLMSLYRALLSHFCCSFKMGLYVSCSMIYTSYIIYFSYKVQTLHCKMNQRFRSLGRTMSEINLKI